MFVHLYNHPMRHLPPWVRVENLLWFFTEPGQVAFDPFAGSGTTIDVAKRMGRRVWSGSPDAADSRTQNCQQDADPDERDQQAAELVGVGADDGPGQDSEEDRGDQGHPRPDRVIPGGVGQHGQDQLGRDERHEVRVLSFPGVRADTAIRTAQETATKTPAAASPRLRSVPRRGGRGVFIGLVSSSSR